jgi:hypothetical protein
MTEQQRKVIEAAVRYVEADTALQNACESRDVEGVGAAATEFSEAWNALTAAVRGMEGA